MSDSPHELSFGTRFWFAWACFFRVLFDGEFAARAYGVREAPALPPPSPEGGQASPDASAEQAEPEPARAAPAAEPRETAALQLLALLQREGRFVDFVQQDVAGHGDADIGAAARVVHEGCRKALRAHVTIEPVRAEDEGQKVTIPAGYDAAEVKLSGDVKGSGPHTGVLRHRGWRATDVKLPVPVKGHDARVLFPAEVEL
ncbi:MAG TPA: DUF2760 domain-containing protein [Minicystis sp.]|nr:DUF2760 domain-containing protein [Minicystis sp.]